jgi:hypothetical protein
MAPLPTITPEQRQEALAKAVEARQARATALGALKNGDVTITAALTDSTLPLWRARVRQVLLALPGIGDATAAGILADLGIAKDRRVAGLGKNQRAALVARLTAA